MLLAFSPFTWLAPVHAVGIVLLSFGLWTVYETGYYENDMVGSVREADPVLPENFSEVRGSIPKYAPWVWAFAMTVPGSFFIALGSDRAMGAVPLLCFGWMAVLASIRVMFALFNRLPKIHRVIPHLLLQVGKYIGYSVVAASSVLGSVLLLSQIAYRWFPYIRYRWSKQPRNFADNPLHGTRFLLFAIFGTISLLFVDYSLHQLVVFGLATVLLGKRAVKEFSRGLVRYAPQACSVTKQSCL